MSRLIAGPAVPGGDTGWHTSLREPPDPPPESVRTYQVELKDFPRSSEAILVDSKTLQQYQLAGSPELKYRRLLEVLCTAIHFYAIQLYQRYHPQPPLSDPTGPLLPKAYPEIHHPNYFKYRRTGYLSGVGFWTEAQILGGVVLFDRGISGNECNSVWLHGKPHCDVDDREVYEIPGSAIFTMIDSASFPLDLSWENLPHMSLATAQDNNIYREFGLAHRSAYEIFVPLHPRERDPSSDHVRKAIEVFMQRNRSS
ncbi:hypothetical protein TWF281_003659 [Arthrobotrys megalospora]